jgi:glycosyltransferase involved in cell wall biosynthesis
MEKFGLKLESINFVNYRPNNLKIWERRKFENGYDLLFYVSDGSIPFMFGKKNFLHFQVPFNNVSENKFLTKVKLSTIRAVVCNSSFTKKIIDSRLGINSTLLYPPVDVKPIKPLKKENIILSVGRFSQLLQGKRQDVLVTAFKELINQRKLEDWELVLVGGSEVGARDYLERLKEAVGGYPIKIVENPSFSSLLQLYGKAKIFWTASGYAIDEEKNPEKVEHFGMSTVEAMAAGCVPIVMAKGGQKEIIEENKNGYFWLEIDCLEEKTLPVINDAKLREKISENAILRSKDFSKEKFTEQVKRLVSKND